MARLPNFIYTYRNLNLLLENQKEPPVLHGRGMRLLYVAIMSLLDAESWRLILTGLDCKPKLHVMDR